MRKVGILLVAMVMLVHLGLGQSPAPLKGPKLIVMTGLWTSPAQENWATLRLGIEGRWDAFSLGVHRLLRFKPGYSSLYTTWQYNPWPVGAEAWFRHYFYPDNDRLRTIGLIGLSFSGKDVDQNPKNFPNPERLGTWINIEPMVGYGLRWEAFDWLFLTVECGVGIDIHGYIPKGRWADFFYWPAGFHGAVMLERRF